METRCSWLTDGVWVMSDADAVESAQEREASTAQMMTDADLDAYVERMAALALVDADDWDDAAYSRWDS